MKLINRDRNRGFTISQCYVWSCERHFLKKAYIVCVCVIFPAVPPLFCSSADKEKLKKINDTVITLYPQYQTLKVWAPVLVLFMISVLILQGERVNRWETTVRKILGARSWKVEATHFIRKEMEVWWQKLWRYENRTGSHHNREVIKEYFKEERKEQKTLR